MDQLLKIRRAKRKLLAGVALLSLTATVAVAQTPSQPALTSAGPAPSADTALGDQAFYLEADTVLRDDKANTWTAQGKVEARYGGRTLRAQEVIYDGSTGAVTARGTVQIINADGTTEFADSIALDKNFQAGVAMGFSTRQLQNVTMSSVAAIKRSEVSTELNRAIFTPCDICQSDGVTPKTPTWSIRAKRIIQDRQKQIIYYRNVVITVHGVPVLFAPVFWHPDPQAVRQSGLLTPRIDYTKRRGLTYEQPYLWVINPSTDLVISPQLNTSVNPFLNGEYRQRFWSGQMDVRFGVGYDKDFNSKAARFGDTSARSYILGEGAFKPDEKWTFGFSAERASDDLIFRRYSIPDVYHNRGLFLTDDQRLISQVYGVRQDQRSYLSVAGFSIQGLRLTDDDRTFPTVGPLIEAHYEPPQDIFGGRLRLSGGGVLLDRRRDNGNITTLRPSDPTKPGVDTARATFSGDWRRSFTTDQGVRLEPFGNLRGDVYNVRQRLKVDGGDGTYSRALATAGVDVSWPFIRTTKDLTVIVEPIAQVAISPNVRDYKDIPNEDSQVFDFDETNLFRANKSSGFDIYEGGQRLNVGARVTANWNWGLQTRLMAGQSFRAEKDPSLPVTTGLQDTSSDWITAASLSYRSALTAYARARVDEQTHEVRRAEVGVNVYGSRALGSVRYLIDQTDPTGLVREDITVNGEILVTKHWGVIGLMTKDIENDVATYTSFGLLYKDECTRMELVYERNGTYDRSFVPSSQITLRLTLATLGAANPQEGNSFW